MENRPATEEPLEVASTKLKESITNLYSLLQNMFLPSSKRDPAFSATFVEEFHKKFEEFERSCDHMHTIIQTYRQREVQRNMYTRVQEHAYRADELLGSLTQQANEARDFRKMIKDFCADQLQHQRLSPETQARVAQMLEDDHERPPAASLL